MDKEALVKCKDCGWEGEAKECSQFFADLELNPAFGGIPSSGPKCPECSSSKVEEIRRSS